VLWVVLAIGAVTAVALAAVVTSRVGSGVNLAEAAYRMQGALDVHSRRMTEGLEPVGHGPTGRPECQACGATRFRGRRGLTRRLGLVFVMMLSGGLLGLWALISKPSVLQCRNCGARYKR
jgi:hypothetical protein